MILNGGILCDKIDMTFWNVKYLNIFVLNVLMVMDFMLSIRILKNDKPYMLLIIVLHPLSQ